jgi:hypothetical protein
MIRVLLWKEFREQRIPTLILSVLGLLVMGVSLPMFESRPDRLTHFGMAALFAWACGMVTGAILLANEQESHTQQFLDMLPKWRSQLWMAKLTFGAVVTLIQIALFTVLCLVMPAEDRRARWLMDVAGIFAAGVLGLGCGLVGSALARSVLAAIGWSLLAMFPGVIALGGVLYLIWMVIIAGIGSVFTWRTEPLEETASVAIIPLLLPVPIFLSGLLWTRADRQRRAAAQLRSRPAEATKLCPRTGIMSTLWLSWRQGWRFQLGLLIGSLLLGPTVLIDPAALWPAFTMILGVLAGISVLADEQFWGTNRFLGEQRLSVGRIWLAKLVSRGAAAVLAAVAVAGMVLLGVMILGALSEGRENRDLFERLGHDHPVRGMIALGSGLSFLTIWLAYGFSFGHLAGMLARKTFVAVAIALPVAVITVSFWIPSMLNGGLSFWQLHAIPLGLLVLPAVSTWAWATDRLLSRRVLLIWVGGLALAFIWLAGSLAYRVWEIPPAGEPFDVAALEEFSRKPDSEKARNFIREAADLKAKQADRLALDAQAEMRRRGVVNVQPDAPKLGFGWLAPGDGMPALVGGWLAGAQAPPPRLMFHEWMDAVVTFGWQPDQKFETDLAALTGGGWIEKLQEAAQQPLGVMTTMPRDLQRLQEVRAMGPQLTTYALQVQAHGNDQEGLELLETALALARHTQSHADLGMYFLGSSIEASAFSAIEHWSQQPTVSPAQLQRLLASLRRHERERPPLSDSIKAEYLQTREILQNPLQPIFGERRTRGENDWRDSLAMSSVLAPWEAERRRRLLNNYFAILLHGAGMSYPELQRRYADFSPPATNPADHSFERGFDNALLEELFPFSDRSYSESEQLHLAKQFRDDTVFRFLIIAQLNRTLGQFHSLCRVRAAEIQIALLLFQHRHGRQAKELAELIPEILPELPLDPFSDLPFHYRVSQGEMLQWNQMIHGDVRHDWFVDDQGMMPMGAAGWGAPGAGMPAAAGTQAPGAPEEGADEAKPKWRPARSGDIGTHRKVPKGWGVLWSVGPDGVDNGGLKQRAFFGSVREARFHATSDFIVLVPKIEKR